MAMAKKFTFPYDQNKLPQWKYVLCCCDEFSSILITCQETNMDVTYAFPTICVHVYRVLSHCKCVCQMFIPRKKFALVCFPVPITDTNAKLYTQKEL